MVDAVSEERRARLAAIRARVAAATPGPWRWRGHRGAKEIDLQSIPGINGNRLLSVMTFWRWGMQGAMPVFRDERQVLRKPAFVTPPEHSHHPWMITAIDHPDARFIEHSREDVEWLLGELDRARTALAGLLGGVTTEQAAGCREVIHTERAWQEAVAAMLGGPREAEVTIEGGEGR